MSGAIDLLGDGKRRSIGGHESTASDATVWLTPPHILAALGEFDLDPCAAPAPRPWPTARQHYTKADNGLTKPWRGRIWLNPPYGPTVMAPFMRRMAEHRCGTALIFARTETALFHETVWRAATAIMFLKGRLCFHRPNGDAAKASAGAPSVLVAYGRHDADRLAACGLAGRVVGLQ